MPQYIDAQLNLGVPYEKESSYGTPTLTEDGYARALMEGAPPGIPNLGKISQNLGFLGSGNEFELGARNDYWQESRMTMGEYVNTEIAALFFQQALSGDVTDTPVVGQTGAHDHTFAMMLDEDGLQLDSRSILEDLGSLKFLWHGMVPDTFGVTIEGGAPPRWNCQLIGSGQYTKLEDLVDDIIVPELPAYNYMHGAATVIKWTGTAGDYGASAYDFSAAGRARLFNFTLQNNLKVGGAERQPGDPIQTAGNPFSGAFQGRMRRGRRSAAIQLGVLLDDQFHNKEHKVMKNNTVLTNFTITMKGAPLGTSTNHEFEVIFPRVRVESVASDVQDGDVLLRMDIKPLKDTVTGGIIKGRIRNANATGIYAAA